jgi:hypothetical protein
MPCVTLARPWTDHDGHGHRAGAVLEVDDVTAARLQAGGYAGALGGGLADSVGGCIADSVGDGSGGSVGGCIADSVGDGSGDAVGG